MRYIIELEQDYQGHGSDWIIYRVSGSKKEFVCRCNREELAAWIAKLFEQEKTNVNHA